MYVKPSRVRLKCKKSPFLQKGDYGSKRCLFEFVFLADKMKILSIIKFILTFFEVLEKS